MKNAADLFVLQKGVLFCNHGSYGAVPKCVLDFKSTLDVEMNENPDLWYRKTCIDLWFQSREAIAPLISTNPSNIAFVVNTTHGANAVLTSLVWQTGDVILVTSLTYGAIRQACDDVTVRHKGVEVKSIELPYPIDSEQQLIDLFAKTADDVIKEGKTPRLAIVDGISSLPAIQFPYEKVTKVLQNKSVQVFIDGAHMPGQVVDLNLDALGADYFAGNIHKWMYGPKGSAFFWVAPQHQATVRPPIVSFDFCKMNSRFSDPMAGHFFWQGTRDNTAFGCIPKCIEFINSLGGMHEIQNYIKNLAQKAENILLAGMVNAERFVLPESCISPSMFNIFGPDLSKKQELNSDLSLRFYDEQKAWLALGRLNKQRFICRVSVQVYNDENDFHKLAKAVNLFATT